MEISFKLQLEKSLRALKDQVAWNLEMKGSDELYIVWLYIDYIRKNSNSKKVS